MVLAHLTPIPGPRAAAACIGVALSAPFSNIASCLKPVEPLTNFIQGFVDIHVLS
jgi:hypothetical protein